MASTVLKEQLSGLMNSMFAEGLLDQQFQQLQMLQDSSCPGFVAEVITLFCEDTERVLRELTKLMDQGGVEYQKVGAYVHQLKGSSSSVGAQNVKLACNQLRQLCEEKDRDGCLKAFNVVQHEYYQLRSKFEKMLQGAQKNVVQLFNHAEAKRPKLKMEASRTIQVTKGLTSPEQFFLDV